MHSCKSSHLGRRLCQLLTGVLCLCQLLFLPAYTAEAEEDKEPHFSDLIITTSKAHLLLFALVNNSTNEDIVQGLHNGLPISFHFFIELYKIEKNWPDLQLVNVEITHTLTYDTLQENYRVVTTEKKQKVETFASLNDALQLMNEINGLQVIDLSLLVPDTSYQLRLKADLYEKSLPMNLHHVVPFISMWDLKTDWHTIEFTY